MSAKAGLTGTRAENNLGLGSVDTGPEEQSKLGSKLRQGGLLRDDEVCVEWDTCKDDCQGGQTGYKVKIS